MAGPSTNQKRGPRHAADDERALGEAAEGNAIDASDQSSGAERQLPDDRDQAHDGRDDKLRDLRRISIICLHLHFIDYIVSVVKTINYACIFVAYKC